MSESYHFLQRLAERTAQIIFEFNPAANRFQYLNASFEGMLGRPREDFLTEPAPLLELVHPEDQEYLKKTYQELLSGSEQQDIEFRLLLPDQDVVWLCATAFILEENQNRTIAGFVRDITPQKHHRETLQKFTAKKNAILEILSHDLAGPLGTIQGLSSMLSARVGKYQDKELSEVIGLITETSKRSIALIRDFVKKEFLESANVELVKRRIDLVSKIRNVMEEYGASEENIEKVFQLSFSQEPIYISLDEVKFMQVINNLISNAIKFTHDNGRIAIHVEDQQESVLITVKDNGIGIPAHLQSELFEKFTKARRPGLKGEPSVGLGMSIIKLIVEWHGGKIWFESQEHKGATFYVQIPKDPAD